MQNRVYSQFWLDYASGTIELDEEFAKRDKEWDLQAALLESIFMALAFGNDTEVEDE